MVYESERIIAFLDKYPVTRGHTLVCPRDHYVTIMETPDDLLYDLIRVVKAVARAQVAALGARGVRVVQNNGSAAGQVIFHLHFHVIPFYEGGRVGRTELSHEEGVEVSAILSRELGKIMPRS